MTLDQLQRAQLCLFAHQEGAASGSLSVMKSICYVIRNRVRAGWHDGSWVAVIDNAHDVAGNEPGPRQPIDIYSRPFQMLMQAVDDIFYATSSDTESAFVNDALYYQFIDRPLRDWFTEHIIKDRKNHPRKAQTGMLVLFD